jgi:hypothetical protein
MKKLINVLSIASIIFISTGAFAQIFDHASNSRVDAGVGYWGTPSKTAPAKAVNEVDLTLEDFTLNLTAAKDPKNNDAYVIKGSINYKINEDDITCLIPSEILYYQKGGVTVCEDDAYNFTLQVGGDVSSTNVYVKVQKTDGGFLYFDSDCGQLSQKIDQGRAQPAPTRNEKTRPNPFSGCKI